MRDVPVNMIDAQYILYTVDTETTGLDPLLHDIVELSISRIDMNTMTREQKTFLIRAVKPDNIEEKALAINGHKREDILGLTVYGRENYIQAEKVLPLIEAWVSEDGGSASDRVFAGQNPMFDFNFMVELWKSNDCLDTFPFINTHNKLVINTKELALFIDICCGQKRDKYNLGSLVESFGVKKGKAHRADEDVRMTEDLLFKMIDGVKEACIGKFKIKK